jgi:hypothetical protein
VYLVDDWRLTQAAFPTDIFNLAAADLITAGELVLALELDLDAAPSTLRIVELDPASGAPALGRPMGQALEVERGADGELRTSTPGRFSFRLHAVSPYIFDLIATFHDVAAEGFWSDDCETIELKLTSAFANEGVTIPGAPDYDLDGDGVPDAFQTRSVLSAARAGE